MKTLVTGGGGFLGGTIVRKLLDRGDQVRVLGRSRYPELEALGVETVKADVRDSEAVLKATQGIEALFHVASRVGIWGKWEKFYQTNVIGAENILEACRKNKIAKLIYTSSPSVTYDGSDQVNIDETHPYAQKHLCNYSKSKALAEQKILEANGRDGLFTAALRPHLIWGPGDTNLIPRLIKKGKEGKLTRVGKGDSLIDITYIDNAAQAHLLAADKLEKGSPVCGQAYFITQGEPVVLWEWVNELFEGLGIPPVKKTISYNTARRLGAFLEVIYTIFGISSEPPMTRFLASQLARPHYFNLAKAEKDLGYRPEINNKEGMKRLISFLLYSPDYS